MGAISERYKTVIAVSGSHGKTTTTALLAEIFIQANKKPTIHAGGELKLINSNYLIGNKKYFITEACEYMDNFLYLKPDIAIVLNVDGDHLDYFGSLDGVQNSFKKFVGLVKDGGISVVCHDDKNSHELLKQKILHLLGFLRQVIFMQKILKNIRLAILLLMHTYVVISLEE